MYYQIPDSAKDAGENIYPMKNIIKYHEYIMKALHLWLVYDFVSYNYVLQRCTVQKSKQYSGKIT